MSDLLQLPETVHAMRKMAGSPFNLGVAIGQLLFGVDVLVHTHLDNEADFRNRPLKVLISTTEFTEAVDSQLHTLRLTKGCTEKFPKDMEVDRKGRRPRRKNASRFINFIEIQYQKLIRKELEGVFLSWNDKQTASFNEGLDCVLNNGIWIVYPTENVVLKVGEGDWSKWLESTCDELGMVESKASRRVLKDYPGEICRGLRPTFM